MTKSEIITVGRKCDHIAIEALRKQIVDNADNIVERHMQDKTGCKEEIITTSAEMLMQCATHQELAFAYATRINEEIMNKLNDLKEVLMVKAMISKTSFKDELNNVFLMLMERE